MAAGSKLGRYELLAKIAAGGMGEIFLARLEGAAGFEKLCVIKRILPHLADDSRFRAMLSAEARIAASMTHANVCHVYALEETDQQLYMVMEYLEGVTLLQVLRSTARRRQKLGFGFISGVIQQACEGLHYAHELRDRSGESLGVVHRDVTPSNLFVTESGMVKLVDFGIAKFRDPAATDAADTSEVKGKYAYMAPEQVRNQAVDRRADVFSLAVVAFEMLTCRRLFHRKTDYLTFRALMEQPLLDLKELRPEVTDELVAVIARGLERDPNARTPTARQFGSELIDALGVHRAWTQSELSELVRAEFAEDLRQQNAEVSAVLDRLGRGSPQTIPWIEVPAIRRATGMGSGSGSNPGADSDGPESFASETDVSARSARNAPRRTAGRTSDVGALVFGRATSVSSAARRPEPPRTLDSPISRSAEPPPPEPRRAPRATSWPVVAVLVGAAAVLGGGLVALEQRMPPETRGAGAMAAGLVREARPERVGAIEPYGAAIRGQEQALDRCTRDHGQALPPEAKAVIVVGVDGRAKQIALQPPGAEDSALGACIRGVLAMVAFPTAPDEKEVALRLAVHP